MMQRVPRRVASFGSTPRWARIIAYPEVTAIDGGFAVAWYQWNGDLRTGFLDGGSGTPQKVGDEILTNEEHTSGTQTEPHRRLADGGFQFLDRTRRQ